MHIKQTIMESLLSDPQYRELLGEKTDIANAIADDLEQSGADYKKVYQLIKIVESYKEYEHLFFLKMIT